MHENASEYILDQDHSAECGDLCDFHHLFHFTAIITASIELFGAPLYIVQSDVKQFKYYPPSEETANKPPIS
jgi:hypothetical protein